MRCPIGFRASYVEFRFVIAYSKLKIYVISARTHKNKVNMVIRLQVYMKYDTSLIRKSLPKVENQFVRCEQHLIREGSAAFLKGPASYDKDTFNSASAAEAS
jgi:hypothetical protein